jgi:hypothetical protein
MFMAMYTKPVGENSQIGLRAMVSLDPLDRTRLRLIRCFTSPGELYRGEPIHDRQHPHDFVSELAATYSYKFDDKNSIFVYAGLPGEPALGPPMFPASSIRNEQSGRADRSSLAGRVST